MEEDAIPWMGPGGTLWFRDLGYEGKSFRLTTRVRKLGCRVAAA